MQHEAPRITRWYDYNYNRQPCRPTSAAARKRSRSSSLMPSSLLPKQQIRPSLPPLQSPRRLHLLSAKVLSTDPASISWLLRYMDSAASLHCTFDLLDIVDPVLLPEPLSIGSANGSIISATHSSRSHLSPLILVHYVPESKIKLISLGALTRQGFNYSIGPDKAMTVLDPSDKHLLMAPPPPPTRRLLVAPANPSLFTKEQVYEFLGHPMMNRSILHLLWSWKNALPGF